MYLNTPVSDINMNPETREEYLEAIFKLSKGSTDIAVRTGEIAKHMGLSPPSVTEILPILESEGYIRYKPYYGVKLTEAGSEVGKRIVRTHRVLEVFLDEYFSLSPEDMHDKACQMEHIFDSDMIDEICERLGAPEVCPHGNEIPSCEKNSCPLDQEG